MYELMYERIVMECYESISKILRSKDITLPMHATRAGHDTRKMYNRYNYNYTLFSYNRYYYNYFKKNHIRYNYKYIIFLVDSS